MRTALQQWGQKAVRGLSKICKSLFLASYPDEDVADLLKSDMQTTSGDDLGLVTQKH